MSCPQPYACRQCGKRLTGEQRLFCGLRCKWAWHEKRRGLPKPPPEPRAPCRRCRGPVQPPRRFFCSRSCAAHEAQRLAIARARAAGGSPMRLIDALREETPPGLCIYCEERVPQRRGTRPRILCGAQECLRLYNRDYQNARRNPPERLEARGDA